VTSTVPSTTAAPTVSSTTAIEPPRPARVLVVGSDEGPLAALAARGYDVVDGLQRGCPIATAVEMQLDDGTVVPTTACEPSALQWERVAAAASPDVVVVSTGPLDRLATRGPGDAVFARPQDLVAQARRLDAEESDLRAAIGAVTRGGADVWIVDHRGDRPKGVFDERLARIGLSDQKVRDIVASDDALGDSIDRALSGETGVRALRVLVIGDSVSLNFARSLADAVPGALDVAWAGENGCPFVRARAIRVAPGTPWEDNRCSTFDQKLPPILAEFAPDVVVLMVSLRELVEQRYWGDDAAHVAGDPGFTAFHDSEMAELVALLEPAGVPLLVTDSPPILAGAMATTAMAHPARIDAWNGQVRRWADSSPSVALLDYAAPLVAFEAAHGNIRADGVHPEIDPLTELAREVFVPAVVSSTRALQDARVGAP
jgi:hypothetical protein